MTIRSPSRSAYGETFEIASDCVTVRDLGAAFTEAAGCPIICSRFSAEVLSANRTLPLEGGAPRGVQSGRSALLRDGERVPMLEGEVKGMPDGAAADVAGVCATLCDETVDGTTTVLRFDHAARLTHMVEAVFHPSRELRSIAAEEWAAGKA